MIVANPYPALPRERGREICEEPEGRSLEDHRHVVEVGPHGLEGRLADPVLRAVPWVIDPNLRRRYPAERDGVFVERVANRAAVPGRPCPDNRRLPIAFDPDLDRVPGGKSLVNGGRRHTLAAVRIGQADFARNLEDDGVVDAVAGGCGLAAVDVADEVR